MDIAAVVVAVDYSLMAAAVDTLHLRGWHYAWVVLVLVVVVVVVVVVGRCYSCWSSR